MWLNNRTAIRLTLTLGLVTFLIALRAQAQFDSSKPRFLTRSKLWTTYRMTGLQGQQADAGPGANDLAGLSYPGSSIRSGEYVEYWNASIVDQSTGGAGAGAKAPNSARNVNSHGEGTFVLAQQGNRKFVSYSGPRTVSPDVVIVGYNAADGPAADLGVDDAKSTYWPGAQPFDPEEPIEIHNYQYGKYIGRDNEAEEIIIVRWMTGMGITATKKAKSSSYQKYDDFIIVENIFEYTGDSNGDGIVDSNDIFGVDLPDLIGVYFAFGNMLSSSLMGETYGVEPYMNWSDWRNNKPPAQDDCYRYSDSPNYRAFIPEDTPNYIGKKMSYGWDDDDPDNDYDDRGEPYAYRYTSHSKGNEEQGQCERQFLSYAFIGMAPLEDNPSDGFTNDAEHYVAPLIPDQPSRCKWWPYFTLQDKPLEPNLLSFTEDQIYDMLALDDPANGNPAFYPDPPRPDDLRQVRTYTHFQIYGPYNLSPGDKVKIVLAYVGGSGADYLANQGVYDPRLAPENQWARSYDPGKTRQFGYGERSLFHNLSLAQEIYELGYDVPDPPPDVEILEIKPDQDGHLQIIFSDEALEALDPDYAGEEARDVAGFRVYQMLTGEAAEKPNEVLTEQRPENISNMLSENWHNGPYKLIDEIKRGQQKSDIGTIEYYPEKHQYVFTDGTTQPSAFKYFYSVRSFETGHNDWNGHGPIPSLESGLSAPEQKTLIGKEAYYLTSQAADRMEQTIRVVPNPYSADHIHEYPNSSVIKFFHIPQKCTISIYSVSGELIARVRHNKPQAIGEWDQQTIKFAGNVAPGIYFWVVESEWMMITVMSRQMGILFPLYM